MRENDSVGAVGPEDVSPISKGPLADLSTLPESETGIQSSIWQSLELKPPPERDAQWISLPSGEALSLAEAEQLPSSSIPIVVVLAALPNTGKTTMLATVLQTFQDGPVNGIMFAGSSTLVGFEERSVLARISSGRSKPDTLRTPGLETGTYLELTIRDSKGPHTLYLADVSGEAFRKFSGAGTDQRLTPLFKRADHIAFLVDGGDLASLGVGAAALTETGFLLRRVLERGILAGHTTISFVVTKWDLLVSAKGMNEAERVATEVFNSLEQKARMIVGNKFVAPRHCVTARPGVAGINGIDSLKALFSTWVEPSTLPETFAKPEDKMSAAELPHFARFRANLKTSPGKIGLWPLRLAAE